MAGIILVPKVNEIYYHSERPKMPKRPSPNLAELPQNPSSWYVAVRKLHHWLENDDGQIVRAFLAIAINMEDGKILASKIFSEEPSPEVVRRIIDRAVRKPMGGSGQKAGRPQRILFEQAALVESLAPFLAEISIESDHRALTEQMDAILAELEGFLKRGEEEDVPGILSVEGLTPDLAGDLFAAAAVFYRAEPWVHLADSQPLAVEFPDRRKTIFVQLMGHAGMDYGFVAYRRWEDLLHVYEAADDVRERIPAGGWLSFSFAEEHLLPFADLDAIEQYGWEIAGKDAYPLPATYYPDRLERPDADLLSLFNVVLRAVPIFVSRHLKSDGKGDYRHAEADIIVPTYAGDIRVRVKYPAGDLPKENFPASVVREFDDEEDDNGALPAFDRRAMEGDMARMFGAFDDGIKNPALKKAQELMYDAWEERNPARRIKMAYRALSVSPDCADAYVLLAEEEADTLQRAAEFYAKGVEAGERALGKKFFRKNAGYFWGILSTRPYMRAREGLANCFWSLGRLDEAREHFTEMLRLNPGDNQGVRYSLLNLLLVDVNALADMTALLKKYDDDWSPNWLYTKTLLAFREQGDSTKANVALDEALEQNSYVPTYLTGEKRIPKHLPAYITLGSEDEAVSYANGHLNHWRRTPGAVDWLRRRTRGDTAKAEKIARPKKKRSRRTTK